MLREIKNSPCLTYSSRILFIKSIFLTKKMLVQYHKEQEQNKIGKLSGLNFRLRQVKFSV